jgi:hypothetical protein
MLKEIAADSDLLPDTVTGTVEIADSDTVAIMLTGSVMLVVVLMFVVVVLAGTVAGVAAPIAESGLLPESSKLWVAAPVAGMEKETLPMCAADSDTLLDTVAGMLDASDRDMELLCDALAGT